MEITLTEEQEAAVVAENGTLDYLETYVLNYCNHIIAKRKEETRARYIRTLSASTDEELAIAAAPLIAEARAAKDAAAAAEEPK